MGLLKVRKAVPGNLFGFVFNQFLGGWMRRFLRLSTVSAIFPRFWEFAWCSAVELSLVKIRSACGKARVKDEVDFRLG